MALIWISAEADARVARRILAIANALDGMSREDAAQSAARRCHWVVRYNAHGLGGLADQWGDGRPPKLSPEEKTELVAVVFAGLDPDASGISAFTREDLVHICQERFGKSLHTPGACQRHPGATAALLTGAEPGGQDLALP